MTYKSKRDIERALDDIDGGTSDTSPLVVFEDPETGEWYDGTGEDAAPVDESDLDEAARSVIIRETVIKTSWERGS